MANIVATSNNLSIMIDFGDYVNPPYDLKSPFVINKRLFEEAFAYEDGIQFITAGRNNHNLYLSHLQLAPINKKIVFLIVDSINGVQPTSKEHLLELIYNL